MKASVAPLDVPVLGQVFTPAQTVEHMLGLIRSTAGRTLEPSAGNGAFSARLPGCVSIEFDERVAPEGALVMDFFDYPLSEQFDTIIGNPPYVRYQSIGATTRARLPQGVLDQRSNLYLFFILKCLAHLKPGGELIFIVPRDFMKLTSAAPLNRLLFAQGAFTHFEETGDRAIFAGACPNCVIFRFEKGRCDRTLDDGRTLGMTNGLLHYGGPAAQGTLGDHFQIRVGAASGADARFTHEQGNAEFVCSTTRATGRTRRMIYEQEHPALAAHKEALLARRIRTFTEANWWRWGRPIPVTPAPRIYVNVKTRHREPFFIHPAIHFDGAVLALFPKASMRLERAVAALNQMNWSEMGFMCDGRLLFSQASLSAAPVACETIQQILEQ